MVGRVGRRRRDLDQHVEQRVQVLPGVVERGRGRARLGVRVEDREVDLVLVGAEVHEQLIDRVEDLGRTGVRAIDLVDGHDHRQSPGHRLLEHVAGLRERTLGRVHEQQHRIDHEQGALDLAAEVGVSGCIDDVETDVGVVDRRLLGEDRDALLALEVTGIHDPIHDGLVGPEGAGLAQHRVHERGLAVIDVGDDGDVAQVFAAGGCVAGGACGAAVGHGGAGLRVVVGTADCPTERLLASRAS